MNLSKSKIFLILCLSFIFGVLVASIVTKIIMVIAAMFFVTLLSVWWSNKYTRLIGFAGLVLILGALRFQTVIAHNNLTPYYGKQAIVLGVVTEEPDVRDDKIYLTLGKLQINDEKINDKILVSVYPNHNFSYGDEIKFTGKILEPKEFPDFNYKNYLSRFGIDAVMYFPGFEVTAQEKGHVIKASLVKVKQKFIENLSQVLPEPQNSFLAGLLVGNKRSIPQWLSDAFKTTGTSHIVAISGYNISIIVWTLDYMLARFGRRTSFLVNTIVILAFVVLTGASASVIRASLIAGFILVAKNMGRLFHPTNALAATAAILIAINPKLLLFDVGFQLSFLAFAGLVYLSPIIGRHFRFLPGILHQALVATISAQIFALPILLYNFDSLSLVSVLTNILVLPIVPFTMLAGFITGIAGFVWPQLAALFAWPAWILLSYIILIVQKTSAIPFASINLGLNLVGVIAYYVALASFLWFIRLRQRDFTNNSNLGSLYPGSRNLMSR